jgi:hypothetical protein
MYGCETSRLPHFLDNRLTDGGEIVSLMRQPPFTPRAIPSTPFCYGLSRTQGHSAAGKIGSIEKFNYLIRIRSSDLPACSTVLQPTSLPRDRNIISLRKFLVVVGLLFSQTFPLETHVKPPRKLISRHFMLR